MKGCGKQFKRGIYSVLRICGKYDYGEKDIVYCSECKKEIEVRVKCAEDELKFLEDWNKDVIVCEDCNKRNVKKQEEMRDKVIELKEIISLLHTKKNGGKKNG